MSASTGSVNSLDWYALAVAATAKSCRNSAKIAKTDATASHCDDTHPLATPAQTSDIHSLGLGLCLIAVTD